MGEPVNEDVKLCRTCGQAVIPRRCDSCGGKLKTGEDSPCNSCVLGGFESAPLPFGEEL